MVRHIAVKLFVFISAALPAVLGTMESLPPCLQGSGVCSSMILQRTAGTLLLHLLGRYALVMAASVTQNCIGTHLLRSEIAYYYYFPPRFNGNVRLVIFLSLVN